MENLNWDMIAMVMIAIIMVVGTVVAVCCLIYGAAQWLITWVFSDYILGMVVGLFALVHLSRYVKKDKSEEDEA